MPSNFKALAGAAGGGDLADPNFKNVTLLLHGDGSNGAQNNTFIDSSTNNFTITRNGNTTQGSFSPYGSNWSNYFDGSGDYLSLPSNTALPTANQSYTIEAWVCPSALTGTHAIIGWGNYGTTNQVNALTISSTSVTNYWWARDLSASYTFAVGSWYHIVAQFDGTTRSIYVNGTRVATDTPTGHNVPSPVTNATVGTANNLSEYFNGYISNVRVVTGQAIYSGSTITVPTVPLTAITNTSLLTCADNRFRDGSTNNFTITRNGDVKVTNFAPFAPSSAYSTTTNGGSAYFDGSGDFLSASSNTAFAFGTGDFAVECWVYRLNSNGTGLFESRGGSAGFLWYIDGSNQYPRFYDQNTAAHFTGTVTVPVGAWTHLAVTRSSGTLYFWVNGQAAGSNAYTVNVGSTATLRFYASNDAAAYLGYGSNMRAVKGSAVYTAAFTPPSSPVTAITNTSLLLNATNAAIFDNSMKNDLETVGNAQISTSVKKFGTGSIAFDANGDYLAIPDSSELELGSGDFTIEAWVYLNSLPATNGIYAIVSKWASTQYSYLTQIRNNSGTMQLGFAYSPDTSSVSTVYANASISATQWYHCAWVRSGTSFKMFLNGTEVTSGATISGSIANATVALNIGRNNDNLEYLNGYIDDLRITKGVARYTANFTAPTAPFPNK